MQYKHINSNLCAGNSLNFRYLKEMWLKSELKWFDCWLCGYGNVYLS